MPRPPRLLLSQSCYHIMTRGNNRHKVFESDDDYLYYLDLINKYKTGHPFEIFHYCLMPNHTHFLIKTNKASDFSTFMKKLNLAYFFHYRKLYGWIGHFWQDRFKSQAVGKDEYFIQCGKYIELNPVRANIIEKPENYKWSSYNFYSQGQENKLLTEDFLYQDLAPNKVMCQEEYVKMIIDDLVIDNYKNKIWGSDPQRYNEAKKIRNHIRLLKNY